MQEPQGLNILTKNCTKTRNGATCVFPYTTNENKIGRYYMKQQALKMKSIYIESSHDSTINVRSRSSAPLYILLVSNSGKKTIFNTHNLSRMQLEEHTSSLRLSRWNSLPVACVLFSTPSPVSTLATPTNMTAAVTSKFSSVI